MNHLNHSFCYFHAKGIGAIRQVQLGFFDIFTKPLACVAGVQRGGRGGNQQAQSVIRGAGRGTPARMLLFSPFHPLKPERWEMSGYQNDPIRITPFCCISVPGSPVSCYSRLLAARKWQTIKTFKGWKRRKGAPICPGFTPNYREKISRPRFRQSVVCNAG